MKRFIIVICAACSILFSCNNNKQEKDSLHGMASGENNIPVSPHIIELEKKLAQKPDSMGLRLMLVNALDSAGMYTHALSEMDSLIKKDSMNYGFWFRKGQLLEHAKDTAKAIASYNNAIKVYPSPDGLLALANLYAETKNEKVLAVCNQINDLRMGRVYDSYTAFFTGIYYERTGNKKMALQYFDASINSNYTFIDAHMEKGFVYYDNKQYNEALKIFNTATTINNTYADAYYWQGKCFEALNDKQKAITNYQQALALNKNIPEAEAALKRLQ
jgi:tetratricopeptide (TPR) repeat protein